MKRITSLAAVFSMLAISCNAQLSADALIGTHAGLHTWQRSPVTLELREDFVYVIRSFNPRLEEQGATKGRWRIEGDHVVLTDVLGAETVLKTYKDECYIPGSGGYSCMARFYLKKGLAEFWNERKKEGC